MIDKALPQAPKYARAAKGMRRVNWSDTYSTEASVRALAEVAGITIKSVEEAPEGKAFFDTEKKAWRCRIKFTDSRGNFTSLTGQTRVSTPVWEVVYQTIRRAYRAAHRNEKFACCKCGAKHYSERERAYVIPLFSHYAGGVCFECGGAGYFIPALYAPSSLVIQSKSQSSTEEARRVEARKNLV